MHMKQISEKRIKSPMPAYTAAACIIVFGLIFPLYRVYGIVLVAVIAAAAYFFSKKCFFKDKIIQEESEPVFRTGIAELDESLEQANVLIEQLRRANISIKNPAVSAHIDRMTRSGDAILAELNAHPEKARKLRRFLTYYLPTSVKFMQTYAEHEAAPTGGENSAEIMRGIENNSETIAKAFETSLDSLYAGEALDISSDIDVLNGMVNAKTSMFE